MISDPKLFKITAAVEAPHSLRSNSLGENTYRSPNGTVGVRVASDNDLFTASQMIPNLASTVQCRHSLLNNELKVSI